MLCVELVYTMTKVVSCVVMTKVGREDTRDPIVFSQTPSVVIGCRLDSSTATVRRNLFRK